ncbi:MAG: hypothetical protein JJU11_08905 [Candidatus Sumerlaeia bacterium]|nr:hypothetical protein [Candidatus Sumerlaeia bacterium]
MVKASIPQNILRVVALATIALFLAVPTGVRAAALPLTLEQMVAIADQVVAVRVVETKSEMASGRITTTTRFSVLENYKGDLKGEAEITYLGGRWGSLVMDVPNMPTFNKGEEAVLFLSRPIDRMPEKVREKYNMDSPLVQSYQVIGGHQGKFLLVNEEGIPNVSDRKAKDAIPFNTRVVRQAGAMRGDPNKGPNWADFHSSLTALSAAYEAKVAEKGEKKEIPGILGKFHIPSRLSDKNIRRFDPLPSMAYASDEELQKLQEAADKAIKARGATKGEDED